MSADQGHEVIFECHRWRAISSYAIRCVCGRPIPIDRGFAKSGVEVEYHPIHIFGDKDHGRIVGMQSLCRLIKVADVCLVRSQLDRARGLVPI